MIWLYLSLGILAVFIVAVLIVGARLPQEFQFEIQQDINGPQESVWKALINPEKFPICATQCRKVTLHNPDGSQWTEDHGSSAVDYRVTAAERPHRRAIHGADSVVPMTIDAEFRLQPTSDGACTNVTVAAGGAIRGGSILAPLFRVIIHLGGARSGFKRYLKTIASSFPNQQS